MTPYRNSSKPEEKKKRFNFWLLLMPFIRLLKLVLYPVFLLLCAVEYVVGPAVATLLGYLFFGDRLHYFEETGVWYRNDANMTYDDLFFIRRRTQVHEDETYPDACFKTAYKSFLGRVDWFTLLENKTEPKDKNVLELSEK